MASNNYQEGIGEPFLEIEAKDPLRVRAWEESRKLWRVAFPAMLSRILLFGIIVITQALIGHVGELQLAAYALIQVFTLRFANGVLVGMSSATETLCGQAFGARQYHKMGVWLQRSCIINFSVATILLLPIFIFSTPIFKFLREMPEIAQEAGYISLWFIPLLYSYVFSWTFQKYLQCQQKNMIVLWFSVISFGMHLLLSWVCVFMLDWGIEGALVAMNISSWLPVLGQFVYVFCGWCPDTWKGFTWSAFKRLLPVLKLSISSGIMLCLEIWYNAVLVLLAGYMNNAKIAISAFSICLNIIGWELMIPLGFLSATSVRVANELGKGDSKAVVFSIKASSSTSMGIGVFFCAVCLIFGNKIGYLFTYNEQVVNSVSELSVLLSLSVLLNSIQPILSGAAVGAGRQSTVAWVNIVCYYAVGVPLGVILGYVANLQVQGIWIGMILGVFLQTIVLGFVTWRTDWDAEVKKAQDRLNRWLLRSAENWNDCSDDQRLLA